MESIISASRHPRWPLRIARCSGGNNEYAMAWSYSTSVITAVKSLYSVFRQVMGRYCSGLPWQPSLGISTVLPFTNHVGMLSESPSSICHTVRLRSSVAWWNCFHQNPQMPSRPGAFQLLSFLTTFPQTFPSTGSTTPGAGASDPGYAQSRIAGSRGSHSPSTPITPSQNRDTSSADGCWKP